MDVCTEEIKIPIDIEVCLKQNTTTSYSSIENLVFRFLENQKPFFQNGFINYSNDPTLYQNIEYIRVVLPENCQSKKIGFWEVELILHVYQLNEETGLEMADDDEQVVALEQCTLPSKSIENLWENLIFDSSIKNSLLDYATSAMIFSRKKVDSKIIAWNRVILLHGPPGTGKTSLCKALAHKLSIRLSSFFPRGELLEINSHSLFSKWFSESGKLVLKLFQKIQELIEDEDSLICVLIDEVESLSAARKSAFNGNEPSDAIRVVNALLTQIDKLKIYSNVLILTTSNITEAIDLAFIDRADIKQYIGLPGPQACYEILRSCLIELIRVDIIADNESLLPYSAFIEKSSPNSINEQSNSVLLYNCCVKCSNYGLSGRTIRKLPFLAHSFSISTKYRIPLFNFIKCLEIAIDKENDSRKFLNS